MLGVSLFKRLLCKSLSKGGILDILKVGHPHPRTKPPVSAQCFETHFYYSWKHFHIFFRR